MPNFMDTFLTLNKKKLRFAFTTCSLSLLVLAFISLAIAFFTGNFPDAKLLFVILFAAGIGLPLFIILLAYLGWQHKQVSRKKTFSKNPFDQIESIGFYKAYTNQASRWFFTEEIKEGKLNGFTFIADVNREASHIIEIEALTEWQKIDKSEYDYLSKKFKQFNIEFGIGSLIKQYDTKRLNFHTIQELKADLIHFTQTLKQENFEPRK